MAPMTNSTHSERLLVEDPSLDEAKCDWMVEDFLQAMRGFTPRELLYCVVAAIDFWAISLLFLL